MALLYAEEIKVDIITVLDAIADTMKRGGAPLTDDQRMLLAGCLAVWLEKYAESKGV